MNKMIISTQGDSTRLCLDELKEICKGLKFIKWLDKGIGLVEIEEGKTFEEVSDVIRNSSQQPIYLRHIFKVEDEISLKDDNELLDVINKYSKKMDFATTYAIQGYVIVSSHNKKDLNDKIFNELTNKGFACNNPNPKQVISYIVINDDMYIGFGYAKNNLSDWTLGMRRYQKYDNQISRAEFKLLEAIETFNIDLSKYEKALDLGASPGGWSKVLLEKGLHVTAVDPAKLNIKDNQLTHYKGLAEEFAKKNKQTFDVIVNDMKMDVCDSAKVMISMYNNLQKDGIAIMTYKLPKNKSKGKILDGDRILREKFDIVAKKQLFHNRNEITVVLKKYK